MWRSDSPSLLGFQCPTTPDAQKGRYKAYESKGFIRERTMIQTALAPEGDCLTLLLNEEKLPGYLWVHTQAWHSDLRAPFHRAEP